MANNIVSQDSIYGCGTVDRAVASDSNPVMVIDNFYWAFSVCRKGKNKEKEAGNGLFYTKKILDNVNLVPYILGVSSSPVYTSGMSYPSYGNHFVILQNTHFEFLHFQW